MLCFVEGGKPENLSTQRPGAKEMATNLIHVAFISKTLCRLQYNAHISLCFDFFGKKPV